MKTVVGIDNGTQSTKILFYDYENRKIIADASSPHDLITYSHSGEDDGTREQDAAWWIKALKTCFKQIPIEIKKSAQAVGVSGQQHGFVPVDINGSPLSPVKLWCDTTTAIECEIISNKFGGESKLISEAGNLILPGYTAGKILWFKNHHPESYALMSKILLPHDYLNYYLTRKFSMEPGDASGTGLLNIRNQKWNNRLIQIIDPVRDLSACLPPLIKPGEPAGFLFKETAGILGLPEGIPVAAGGGDNMMGAIGTGAVRDGFMTMSLGTSGTLYGYSDTPVIDPDGYLAAFISSSGGWLPLLCTMNCTVASELIRNLFKQEVKQIDDLAGQSPAGSEGIITLPFFNGERTPNLPNGKGSIMGMTRSNTKEANILRSALESAILGMRLGLDSFQNLGFKPQEICLIGGGSNSFLWRQITADILNLPVKIPKVKEAAAFGAAIQALWTIEKLKGSKEDITRLTDIHIRFEEAKTCFPKEQEVKIYKKVYREYAGYVAALSKLYK